MVCVKKVYLSGLPLLSHTAIKTPFLLKAVCSQEVGSVGLVTATGSWADQCLPKQAHGTDRFTYGSVYILSLTKLV